MKIEKLGTPEEKPHVREDINLQFLGSDRVLLEIIEVPRLKKSTILDPNTGKPVDKAQGDYDRWHLRGKVIAIGVDVPSKMPLNVGDKIFLEQAQAATMFLLNGRQLLLTRTSNILLAYSENNLTS